MNSSNSNSSSSSSSSSEMPRPVSLFSKLAGLELSGLMKISGTSSQHPAPKPFAQEERSAEGESAPSCLLSQLDGIANDVVPKIKAEVEANFDLRVFLGTPELMQDSLLQGEGGGNNKENSNNELQTALQHFAAEQCVWVCPPGRQVTTKSATAAAGLIRNHLNANMLWTIPAEEESDVLSVYKRRRLIWQDGLCSAVLRLKQGKLDVFYILSGDPPSNTSNSNSNSTTSGNNNSSSASSKYAGWNLNGIFCSAEFCRSLLDTAGKQASSTQQVVIPRARRQQETTSAMNEQKDDDNDDDIVGSSGNEERDDEHCCILLGVPRPFLQRMLALGITPLLITDSTTFVSLGKAKGGLYSLKADLTSSAGLLEKTKDGEAFLVRGSVQLATVVDCLGEYFFSLHQAARVTADVPRIVARQAFVGAVRVPLRMTVLCSGGVDDAGISTSASTSSSSSGPSASSKTRSLHRMTLSGEILPSAIAPLVAALVAAGRSSSTKSKAGLRGSSSVARPLPVSSTDLDPKALATMRVPSSLAAASLPQPLSSSSASSSASLSTSTGFVLRNPMKIITRSIVEVDDADKRDRDLESSARATAADANNVPYFRLRLTSPGRLSYLGCLCVASDSMSLGEDGLYERCLRQVEEVSWSLELDNSPHVDNSSGKRKREGAADVGGPSRTSARVDYSLNKPGDVLGLYTVKDTALAVKETLMRIGGGREYSEFAE